MSLIWAADIEDLAEENTSFRKVLWVGKFSELTLMSLEPGEEIGVEVHRKNDQFLRIEEGHGQVLAGPDQQHLTETIDVEDDWGIVIPAGVWHNVINTGDGPLKLYTLYAPAEHAPDTVHETKEEAEAAGH